MTYTINKTDGTLLTTVEASTIDITTNVTLIGKNYSGYGALIATNFIHMMENFADINAPSVGNPLIGQLWFDKSEDLIKVRNGINQWSRMSVLTSATQPISSQTNDLWFDTGNSQLKYYTGSGYLNSSVPEGPTATGLQIRFLELQSVDGPNELTTQGVVIPVIVLFSNDSSATRQVAAVFSSNIVPFYFDRENQSPTTQSTDDIVAVFSALGGVGGGAAGLVNPGITYSTDVSALATIPNADNADALGGELPGYYLNYANFSNEGAAPFYRDDQTSLPTVHNTHDLGSVAKSFRQVYSTNFTGNLIGNADTATSATSADTLTTPRTIAISGAVSGTGVAFDGSGNITIATTQNSHTHITSDITAFAEDVQDLVGPMLVNGTHSNITFVYDDGGAVINATVAAIASFTDLTVTGNLIVSGTTTQMNTSTLTIEDPIIQLANNNTGGTVPYIGLQAERGSIDAYWVFKESNDAWYAVRSSADSFGALDTATATATELLDIHGKTLSGTTLVSTVATGSSPFTVASTTKVANLNAELLDGYTSAKANTANTVVVRDTNTIRATNFNGSTFTSTVATGTSPFTVASTTKVANLNADLLDGLSSHQTANNSIPVRSAGGVINATTFDGVATSAQYADLAERYRTDMPVVPSDVVKIGGEYEITKTTWSNDEEVFGVISTDPALMMNAGAGDDLTHPYVALTGRVPCKVKGPVSKGQRLISSSIAGVAMAATDQSGTFQVFGRSLVDKTSEGVEIIEIVIGR